MRLPRIQISRFSRVPPALFVVAVPLFLVTGAVTWAFNNPGLYHGGFERYNVSRVTGITDPDLRQVAKDIRGYFNSRQEPLDVRARVFGVERALFKPKEVVHMRDVKRLVQGVYAAAAVTGLYLLAYTGLGFARRRQRFTEDLARLLLWGGSLTVALILAVGLFALLGFDTLFTKFHEISFTNDFWQLDSRTDFLVMLFPEEFWFDATMWVAMRALIAALLIGGASGGYLVYLRRRGKTGPNEAAGQPEEAQWVQ